MLEVVSLHATPGRNVVFRSGHFEHRAVRQGAGRLHESFSIGASADDDGTIVVLERTRGDFRRRGRGIVHQHDHRHLRVEGFVGRFEARVECRIFGFRFENELVFRQKEVDHLHSLVHQSAPISSQIKDETLSTIGFELFDGSTEIASSIFGVTFQQHVAGTIRQYGVEHHRGAHNFLACDAHTHGLRHARTLHGERERRAGLPPQPLRDGIAVLTFALFAANAHIFAINFENDIARTHTRLVGRHSHVRTVESTAIGSFMIANGRTNSGILSGGQGTKLIGAVFLIKFGIRIEVAQHIEDGIAHGLLGIQRVDVIEVEVAIESIKDVERFGRLKIVVFLRMKR